MQVHNESIMQAESGVLLANTAALNAAPGSAQLFGRKSELWLEVMPRDDLRPELEPSVDHATLADWRLGVAGQTLTVGRWLHPAAPDDNAIDVVQDMPVVDLALWLVQGWQTLLFGRGTASAGQLHLAACNRQRTLPDVVLRRRDAGLQVSWRAQSQRGNDGFLFDQPAGSEVVSVACLKALTEDLTRWVAARCAEDHVADARLAQLLAWGRAEDRLGSVEAWLDGVLPGGRAWLAKRAPNAMVELSVHGDSTAPALGFLRTAYALADSSELDRVWDTLHGALSAKSVAADLRRVAQQAHSRLDPNRPWQSGYDLAAQVRPTLQGLLAMPKTGQRAFDVAAVFAHWEIPVVRAEGLPQAVQGAALVDERGRAAVLVNASSTLGRTSTGYKAILAHELCHLLFDRTATGTLGQVDLRHDLARAQLLEQRANAFAAELLLPRARVQQEASAKRITRSALRSLAREYSAGIQLAEYQAENLGLTIVADV